MNRGGGDESNSRNLLMSLISSDFPKPDLFLFMRSKLDNNLIDTTNYKIDDLFNLAVAQGLNNIDIVCLYENSELNSPIIDEITFTRNDGGYGLFLIVIEGNIEITEITYNNKTYHKYSGKLL